jgi:uncharacterized protein (DUF362 family)/Pyruvate/2-oxoacid:ferredoxin oxidoreductase delta subunit
MGTVSVYKCPSYEYKEVKESVYHCLNNSKMSKNLFKGAKVLIKANLLMKKSPEEAVTTNPMMIQAISEYLIEKGCTPIIGDSPAGPFTKRALKEIYKASGMDRAAENSGAQLNYNVGFSEVVGEKSKKLKKFDIINIVLESDFVISAAKLKTHGMMTYTGAVKNLFGVIPGLTKASYHFKLVEKDHFGEHLIDIAEYVKPDYSIIDAIEGMEGNGPSGGVKRKVGLVIGGDNSYETDLIAAEVVSIDPGLIPTIYLAEKRGLMDGNIEVIGDNYKELDIKPFALPDSTEITFLPKNTPNWLRNILLSNLKAKPKFLHEKCISCGHCVRNCPAKVIAMNKNNKPIVDLKGCISCFCCHEVCPAHAVEIKKPLLSKIFIK